MSSLARSTWAASISLNSLLVAASRSSGFSRKAISVQKHSLTGSGLIHQPSPKASARLKATTESERLLACALPFWNHRMAVCLSCGPSCPAQMDSALVCQSNSPFLTEFDGRPKAAIVRGDEAKSMDRRASPLGARRGQHLTAVGVLPQRGFHARALVSAMQRWRASCRGLRDRRPRIARRTSRKAAHFLRQVL